MAEIKQLVPLTPKPGIQRDGTVLKSDGYVDGQWVRFQRGLPRKIGGFQQITDELRGPITDCLVWSRAAMNAIYSFSPSGIEMVLVDNNGLGGSIINRDPAGFTETTNTIWSTASQYDDAVGSQGTVILAHRSSSMANIDDTTAFKPFLGLASGSTVFTEITDAPAVSGGVFSVAPYTFAHGSDGFIAWSDANLPQTWYTSAAPIGDAGADRVTGAKIVKGLALRSGSGPAGLLWSLDSVLRFDYTGSSTIFKFTHLTTQSSILSQNSVIEYDGIYYWVGIDRFLMCDGGRVQELPNQMNINWFFDNLNYAQRQKVWAMKVPRFGEIHWYFPFGDSDVCTHCVIYNVREQCWYDNRISRSAGFYSQVFKYPVMADSTPSETKLRIDLSSIVGGFSVGDRLLGTATGATGIILEIDSSSYLVERDPTTPLFVALEGVLNTTTSGTATIDTVTRLYAVHTHEKGVDEVRGEVVSAIDSYVVSPNIGVIAGSPSQLPINRWTRIVRIEPDFVQSGEMNLTVLANEFANSPETSSSLYNFTNGTERIDLREHKREVRLKFQSNVVGGDFQMGEVLLHMEPGDIRN